MKQADYYKKFLYIKMSETIYYQRNKETISNRAKDYYKAYIRHHSFYLVIFLTFFYKFVFI